MLIADDIDATSATDATPGTDATDATSSDDTPTDMPPPPPPCTAPMSECDGDPATVCETDTSSSTRHCGTCGNTCGSTEVCSNGLCRTDCEDTLNNCDGTCFDVTRSREHCGGCDQACEDHEVCIDGQCDGCSGDEVRCANTCIEESENNCGVCGYVCPARENAAAVCTKGNCDYFCSQGFGDCDDDLSNGCEDPLDTDQNCGTCGRSCGAVPNGTSTCSERVCVVSTCDEGWFDLDGDSANGCEFGFQHLPGLSGVPAGFEAGSTRFALSRNGSTTYLYAMTYRSSTVTRSSLGGSGATTFDSGLTDAQELAVTDGGVGFVAGLNFLRPFTGTSSDSIIESFEYTTSLAIARSLAAFKPIGANYTAGLLTGSISSLDWFAFAENVSSDIYYGANSNIPTNCTYFVDVYSLCRVASRPMYVRGFDFFEHEGQQYVLVFSRTSATPFELVAEVYRIDHASRQLVRVASPVNTRLPGTGGAYVSFLPASGSTPPGFAVAASNEILIGRFASMALGSWSEEARLTGPQHVNGVLALDSKNILLTVNRPSAGGGALLVMQTSPTAPAERFVEVASFPGDPNLRAPMLDPGNASHVMVPGASSLQAYRWQIAP